MVHAAGKVASGANYDPSGSIEAKQPPTAGDARPAARDAELAGLAVTGGARGGVPALAHDPAD